MKTSYIVLGVIVVLLVLLGGCVVMGYNEAKQARNACDAQYGNVEVVLQRRADLVPNLIATVKGAANFERTTLEAVVNARAAATQLKLNPGDLEDPAKVKKFMDAQAELGKSLGRLLAVAESYPELKANGNYRDLQSQLEGTENRIAEERRKYNRRVQELSNVLDTFPSNLGAGFAGVRRYEQFKAEQDAAVAPKVSF